MEKGDIFMTKVMSGSEGLPYGYGIGRVQPVSKVPMDIKKEREKQNEERRANLVQQKTFLEELRRQQKLQQEQEAEKERRFDRRI